MADALKTAVRAYAQAHADRDVLATTPIPGLSLMCRETPAGILHSVYRPLVCMVLQGQSTSSSEQKKPTLPPDSRSSSPPTCR